VLAAAALSFLVFVLLYGIPRFRVTAEIAWVLGVAVGLVTAWDVVRDRRLGRGRGRAVREPA
jgi:hypothetical protein